MSASAYRSVEAVVRERIELLGAERETEAYRRAFHMGRSVAIMRIARAAGGATGAVFGVAVFALGLFELGEGPPYGRSELRDALVATLLLGWVFAAAAFLLWYSAASWRLATSPPPVAISGGATDSAALERLERSDPLGAMRSLASRWEFAGAALPMVAVTLLAPLTLHAAVAAVLFPQEFMVDLGFWIALSALLVGHAHLALVIALLLWVRSFRWRLPEEVHASVGRSWARGLVAAVVTACLPGIVLIGIPPLISLATGLAFVPFMYGMTAKALVVERERLSPSSKG
jgi:hypothetical protein